MIVVIHKTNLNAAIFRRFETDVSGVLLLGGRRGATAQWGVRLIFKFDSRLSTVAVFFLTLAATMDERFFVRLCF